MEDLANCYLAIVAICHQTSPIGERQLRGSISGDVMVGWDFLKEQFLARAVADPRLALPPTWGELTPQYLSEIYEDPDSGLSLGRVNERTYFINDLGRLMEADSYTYISQAYARVGERIAGANGFIAYLSKYKAYSDPLSKKAFFFLSLAMNECGWNATDPESLLSPIDYHELRGHLRIGTLRINNAPLRDKIQLGLPVDDEEDIDLRAAAQEANNRISHGAGITNSVLHYALWNIFRNCCVRNPRETHCLECPSNCTLPHQYQKMEGYSRRCLFTDICSSSGQDEKPLDPPHIGHFY